MHGFLTVGDWCGNGGLVGTFNPPGLFRDQLYSKNSIVVYLMGPLICLLLLFLFLKIFIFFFGCIGFWLQHRDLSLQHTGFS